MRWIILALVLAGCATVTPAPVVKTLCLPMPAYSEAQQSAAADELAALPGGSVLATFIVDYAGMRAANRACLGRGTTAR